MQTIGTASVCIGVFSVPVTRELSVRSNLFYPSKKSGFLKEVAYTEIIIVKICCNSKVKIQLNVTQEN